MKYLGGHKIYFPFCYYNSNLVSSWQNKILLKTKVFCWDLCIDLPGIFQIHMDTVHVCASLLCWGIYFAYTHTQNHTPFFYWLKWKLPFIYFKALVCSFTEPINSIETELIFLLRFWRHVIYESRDLIHFVSHYVLYTQQSLQFFMY